MYDVTGQMFGYLLLYDTLPRNLMAYHNNCSIVGQEFGQDLPRCLPDAWGLKGPISKMASSRRCQHAFLFHFGLHFGRTYKHFQNSGIVGISLVVQWLRLHTLNPGVRSSIPSQGTRSHPWQLKDRACRN